MPVRSSSHAINPRSCDTLRRYNGWWASCGHSDPGDRKIFSIFGGGRRYEGRWPKNMSFEDPPLSEFFQDVPPPPPLLTKSRHASSSSSSLQIALRQIRRRNRRRRLFYHLTMIALSLILETLDLALRHCTTTKHLLRLTRFKT